MKYELKTFCQDPLDDTGEENNPVEYWDEVTEEYLKDVHLEQLRQDEALPSFAKEEMLREGYWSPTEENFEDWLETVISEGWVRRS